MNVISCTYDLIAGKAKDSWSLLDSQPSRIGELWVQRQTLFQKIKVEK